MKPWPTDPEPREGTCDEDKRKTMSLSPTGLMSSASDALFYSYMSPILRRGARLHRQRRRNKDRDNSGGDDIRPNLARSMRRLVSSRAVNAEEEQIDIDELTAGDVYGIPRNMMSEDLAANFWKAHRRIASSGDAAKRGGTRNFLLVLWELSKATYLRAAGWQLVVTACQVSLPLLVREILLLLESHPGESFRRQGMPLAFVIFAVSALDGVGAERQKYLAYKTGITLRSAVVSAAHGHVLGLTPDGRAGLTSGQITNLVAVDSQKLFELAQDGNYSWSCPLAMVVVSVLLIIELGPSSVVGIVAMFLFIPLVKWIVRRMMTIRKLRAVAADARVETTSSMLQGMRFAKLNRYEGRFVDRILELRNVEVRHLRIELVYFAATMFLTVVSPVVASGLSFICYVLVDEENILTASRTFTSLFLFSALRFPINYLGKLIGKAAQGLQACHRFSLFFDREAIVAAEDSTNGIKSKGVGALDGTRTPNSSDDDTVSSPLGHCTAAEADRLPSLDEAPLIDVSADFTVGDPSTTGMSFTVSGIEMRVRRGSLHCIVGPVGAGKSTIVRGLIGELPPRLPGPDSKFHVEGCVSFASQVPFVLNATVRDNILFGDPYDAERYGRCLDATCLASDIAEFRHGDRTEIGERGVTLSGGQKARLSLARAAYSRSDVVILDDVLSALDAGTSRAVFERLFRPVESGRKGLFSDRAVVLVTHASHFLNRVDEIVVVAAGRCVFSGSWRDLEDCRPEDKFEVDAVDAIRNSVQEVVVEDGGDGESAEKKEGGVGKAEASKESTDGGDEGRIMTVEERQFGLSQASTWLSWCRYSGGPGFIFVVVISMVLDRGMYVMTEIWLALWTDGATDPITWLGRTYPPQTDGFGAQREYVKMYTGILLLGCVFTLFRTNWLIQGGARCANRVFKVMLNRTVHAPMSFFDTTPLGRLMNRLVFFHRRSSSFRFISRANMNPLILSRFTYDTETLDITLTTNMTMLFTSVGWLLTGIILQTVILPWQIVMISFIMLIYYLLVLHYRKSATDLQRLDATSRSPVQAQLSEAVDGYSTMRVFGKSAYFSAVFRRALDLNSGILMNFQSSQRWLAVRIQLLGSLAVLFSVSFVVSFNDVIDLDPGIAAILIIWSANLTISLSFFVLGFSEAEASMTSLERMSAMTRVQQEEDDTRQNEVVDKSWPRSGGLAFDEVSLRYRPGLPLSLNGLSFQLKSGIRCGVVGRTGAGKSTLAAALFRLVELEQGAIEFDGKDISKLALSDVRGRPGGMLMIPQDPVLFPGTLKECLDPFGDYTDAQVAEALLSVRGASRGLNDINATVEEGGRNFSVGERQLICLGRALLAKAKLLFLDEATASVDSETDALIQKMLRTRFEGTTLITIAHRLNTIMDYDVVLVMDQGRCAEFGSPAELLENEGGIFTSLVDATGKESSHTLRRIALNQARST